MLGGAREADDAVLPNSPTEVDLTENLVYLNERALPKGQGLPLDTFIKAWQYSGYGTVTAERRAT